MRRLHLPFFYGWLLVAIGFVTMAVGSMPAPPSRLGRRDLAGRAAQGPRRCRTNEQRGQNPGASNEVGVPLVSAPLGVKQKRGPQRRPC